MPSLPAMTLAAIPEVHIPLPAGSGRNGPLGGGVASVEQAEAGNPPIGHVPSPAIPVPSP